MIQDEETPIAGAIDTANKLKQPESAQHPAAVEQIWDKDLNWKSIITTLEDIISGLIHLHSQDTVHRDLKPRNGILNT